MHASVRVAALLRQFVPVLRLRQQLAYRALSTATRHKITAYSGLSVCQFHAAFKTYTQGDSDVISMPAGFRRHLVGKTLKNVFHCDIALKYALLAR